MQGYQNYGQNNQNYQNNNQNYQNYNNSYNNYSNYNNQSSYNQYNQNNQNNNIYNNEYRRPMRNEQTILNDMTQISRASNQPVPQISFDSVNTSYLFSANLGVWKEINHLPYTIRLPLSIFSCPSSVVWGTLGIITGRKSKAESTFHRMKKTVIILICSILPIALLCQFVPAYIRALVALIYIICCYYITIKQYKRFIFGANQAGASIVSSQNEIEALKFEAAKSQEQTDLSKQQDQMENNSKQFKFIQSKMGKWMIKHIEVTIQDQIKNLQAHPQNGIIGSQQPYRAM